MAREIRRGGRSSHPANGRRQHAGLFVHEAVLAASLDEKSRMEGGGRYLWWSLFAMADGTVDGEILAVMM